MAKEIDKRASADIPLNFPITFDGETISKLTMRRPKLKDSKLAAAQPGDDTERGIWMIARLCNVQPELLDELDLSDFDAVEKQFGSFRGA